MSATVGRAPLWGISQVVTADGLRSYPVGFADIAADTAAAQDELRRLGVEPGQSVLYTSLMSEAALYTPYLDATWQLGAVVSCADATGPDAYRVPMLIGALPRLAAVIGINAAVLDGLEAGGRDLAAVFATVPAVLARPDAWPRLRDAAVPALLWAQLGPVIAVECRARRGAHVPAGWSVEAHGPYTVVRAGAGRACGEAPWRVATAVSVDDGPCGCGRSGARIRLAE